MKTAHDFNEAAVIKRALERPCPNCGAKAGVRCGWWQEPVDNPGYRQRRHWKHYAGLVHPERVTLAWREMLNEEVAAG